MTTNETNEEHQKPITGDTDAQNGIGDTDTGAGANPPLDYRNSPEYRNSAEYHLNRERYIAGSLRFDHELYLSEAEAWKLHYARRLRDAEADPTGRAIMRFRAWEELRYVCDMPAGYAAEYVSELDSKRGRLLYEAWLAINLAINAYELAAFKEGDYYGIGGRHPIS